MRGKTCAFFGLPPPPLVIPINDEALDVAVEKLKGERMYAVMNDEQKHIVDRVIPAARPDTAPEEHLIFVDASGGAGKTYVFETLNHLLAGEEIPVINVAWTGILANLLPRGRTMHNRFKLPFGLTKDKYLSTMSIISKDAQALKNAKVIICDEAPMAPIWAWQSIDEFNS
jgi:hypothetical protein